MSKGSGDLTLISVYIGNHLGAVTNILKNRCCYFYAEYGIMLYTKDIIRAIWDAQGYGNLAVWDDGTTQIVEPGQVPVKDGLPPRAVFKPLPLVGGFPLLDYALYDKGLQDQIEAVVQSAGGAIERE